MKYLSLLTTVFLLLFSFIYACHADAKVMRVRPEGSAVIADAKRMVGEGRYAEALDILLEFEKSATDGSSQISDSILLATYMQIGHIYCGYQDFVSAVKVYEKALPYAGGHPKSKMTLMHNLSTCACFIGDSVRARKYADAIMAMSLTDTYRQKYMYAVCKAYYEKNFGDPRRSPHYFRKSLEYVDKGGLPLKHRSTPISELYEYYDERDMADSARYWLGPYVELADQFNISPMMAESKRGQLKFAIIDGDLPQIRKRFDEYFTITDSLYKPIYFIDLSSRHKNYSLELADHRISDLSSTITLQKFLIVILILIVGIGVAAYFMQNRIKSIRHELFRKNREIAISDSMQTDAVKNDDQQDPPSPRLIDEIERYLSDPDVFCDPELSLNAVAKALGSNPTYVSQAINGEAGMNFRSYVNERRIRLARQILTNPDSSSVFTLQAISEKVGFKSTSNFNIAFKKVTGMTPSAYMKEARRQA